MLNSRIDTVIVYA